jgi:hypothetical protein
MTNPPQRSPRVKVGGLFHFGRMLDKIRAHQCGTLPEEYLPNLGLSLGLDGRICSFLGVAFTDVCTRAQQGGTDEEILAWCCERSGFQLTEERAHIWNEYARKVGWNDVPGRFLRRVRAEDGLMDREDLVTAFDVIDHREGRK